MHSSICSLLTKLVHLAVHLCPGTTYYRAAEGDGAPQVTWWNRLYWYALVTLQEVAQQLHQMQEEGVKPSNSPWASPIVLVRKKDGVLCICVDYHSLNAVTKVDRFPLPRISDLLDQLGRS